MKLFSFVFQAIYLLISIEDGFDIPLHDRPGFIHALIQTRLFVNLFRVLHLL
jgi:hypothetical protein